MLANRLFFVSLLAVTAFKLWAMQLFPITCDEAYYWLWQKHLQLSYVDHPPFIAFFNKFVGWFGEYNLFHYRLAGLLIALLTTFFIYQTGKTLFDRRIGILAATFFILVPHYIIIWLTVTIDNPLALFWAISLFCAAKIVKEGKCIYWFWLGLAAGLGLLCKYTMAFFFLPWFLFLLVDRDSRKWFFTLLPYLSFLLSICVFSPVIFWNWQNYFVSFLFHAGRVGRTDFVQNFLDLLADQLVHFTPILFLGLIIYARQLWQKSRFLFLFSVPLLAIFFGFTFFIRVWAHWVTVYQFAAVIGVAVLVSHSEKLLKRVVIGLWVFDLLLVVLILFGSSMVLPRQVLYQKNYELFSKYGNIPKDTYIITPYLGASSQLAFYTRRPAYMAQGALKIEEHGFGQKQFDLWGFPGMKKGGAVVYYGMKNKETLQKLGKIFSKVEIRDDLDFYVIESYLDDLVPYYCRGFKGSARL